MQQDSNVEVDIVARIVLLVDYRRGFWSSTRNVHTRSSLDVEKIGAELRSFGHSVEIVGFSELDLSCPNWESAYVLYTSSEDVGSHYKRYIEAKVFGLRMAGARMVPEPELLLAHHDKVMMECVRQISLRGAPGQPHSRSYGSLEEFTSVPFEGPAVMKPATGAGSRGVSLVQGEKEARKIATRLSRTLDLPGSIFEVAKRLRRRGYIPRSLHRRAIVLQQFIPGLAGDYKILRYGGRFYVLGRANRPDDFRASGGGRLDYSPHENVDVFPLLDAAALWSDAIGSPFCSLDIAYDPVANVDPRLIEFQCVNFGTAAAENSLCYYTKTSAGWVRVDERCDMEAVFAQAAADYITQDFQQRGGN